MNTGFKYTMEEIVEGLSKTALVDKEGSLIGYSPRNRVPTHDGLIKTKNQMIEEGFLTMKEFEAMLMLLSEGKKYEDLREFKGFSPE